MLNIKTLSVLFLMAGLGFLQCENPALLIYDRHTPLRIGLMRLGGLEEKYLALAQAETEKFYQAKVFDLGNRPLPKSAWYEPRQRYRADKLIAWLQDIKPDSIDILVGLTASDISTTKDEHKDWGILGLAYCPGESCVVSTFRMKKGAASQAHFEERFAKILLHELGHNLGVQHCKASKKCLMRDACGTVKSIDEERKSVCGVCKKRLGELLR